MVLFLTDLMKQLGFCPNVKGYFYLREAVLISLSSPTSLRVSIDLYPQIAKKYKTTPKGVERAIRVAIEVAYLRVDTDIMIDFFGYTVNYKRSRPTNAQMIALLTDYSRLHLPNDIRF